MWESLLLATGMAAFALVGVMAFMRRDHKVELVVTYHQSPPAAIWRLLTDHAVEPQWLPAFGSVVRQADIAGHEVWTHTSTDQVFSFTLMTVSAIPERRYERLLLRDHQPRNQSWDGRWIYELEPSGSGTRLRVTEYGWTDGFPFFIHAARRRRSRRLLEVLRQPDRTGVERSSGDSGAAIALSPIPLSMLKPNVCTRRPLRASSDTRQTPGVTTMMRANAYAALPDIDLRVDGRMMAVTLVTGNSFHASASIP